MIHSLLYLSFIVQIHSGHTGCPFLLSNTLSSDGSYTQPVNVAKDLLLNTNNTEVIYNEYKH